MKQKRSMIIVLILFILLMGGVVSGNVLATDSERLDPADLDAIEPATFTLKKSLTSDGPWSDVLGNLTVGYSTTLDQTGNYIYIQVDSLTAAPALADGLHEIYFDSFRVPDDFWTYWADNGIDENATGDEAVMWQILNGELPMFYIKSAGGSYSLVDGYLYQTGDDEITPWQVSDDLPLATYHFGGEVTDTLGASEYLNIQITFTKQATVSIMPQTSIIDGCGYMDVYIHLADAHDLYAVDISLAFDETVLEVVDLDTGKAGVNLQPLDDWFVAGYWVHNEADNANGTIHYTAAQLNTTLPANGAGDIAMIRFRARSIGSSAISIINAELSDRDGYLVGRPIEWDEPAATITTQFTEASTPVLNISRLNASDVQLSWNAESTDDVSSYHFYRSDTPYFDVDASTPYQELANTGTNPMTFDDSVLGNVDINYFYALKAECVTGLMSPASDQVGKFEFELWETNATDYSWIGLVLENPDISTDKILADHIENNIYEGTAIVKTINRWNPVGQSFTTYIHGDISTSVFDATVNQPYQIEIDIDGTTLGSVIWAQVGRLPEISENTYTLYETLTTDYSWILQPLVMTYILDSSELADHIELNSSGSVEVSSVNRWNGEAQSFTTDPGSSPIDTQFGYPYLIEVNVTNGDNVTWP